MTDALNQEQLLRSRALELAIASVRTPEHDPTPFVERAETFYLFLRGPQPEVPLPPTVVRAGHEVLGGGSVSADLSQQFHNTDEDGSL